MNLFETVRSRIASPSRTFIIKADGTRLSYGDMLDRTSPEFRAMSNEYRLLMGQRMQQRGMTMPGPWGGR